MCQETVFWALIVTKILQLQGDKVPLDLCIHNFQAIILPYTRDCVEVSVCCYIIEGLGGGGAKSSVNFVMGSWHP